MPWVAVLVGLLAPLGLCVAHVVRYPTLSPIDEMLHVDGVDRARDGRVIRDGDQVEQPALRSAACRGIDGAAGFAPCDRARIDPDAFPGRGYNQQSQQPPTYYFVTGAVSRLFETLPGVDDRVTAYRLASVGWLLAGLAVLGIALARLGVAPVPLAAALTLCGTPMTVVHLSSTTNNDATAVLAGAVVVWGIVEVVARRWPPWTLALSGAGALALKGTFVLAVLAGAVALLVAAAQRHTTGRRALASSSWLVGGGALAGGLFLVARGAWARRPLIEVYEYAHQWHRDAMPWAELLTPEFGFPLLDAIFGAPLGGDASRAMTSAVTFLFAAGSTAATVLVRRSPAAALGAGGLVGCVAANPVIVVMNYASLEMWIPLLHRYSLCLLPFLVVPIAVAATRWRVGAASLVAVSSLSTIATTLALVGV